MTPIIKQLIDQATDDILGVQVLDQELFVRLIVQECANIADSTQDITAGCGYITQTIGSRIKEYFGVE